LSLLGSLVAYGTTSKAEHLPSGKCRIAIEGEQTPHTQMLGGSDNRRIA